MAAEVAKPPAIRFEAVEKAFGEHRVLRGLDLTIPCGDITVIIGRSGEGKSVTLKHAMGLVRPDRGRVWFGDVDLGALDRAALRRLRLRMGMVFQNAALFDSMTVYDNVAFPLREHTRLKEAEIRERVMPLLEQLRLAEAADRLPAELSGGMRKRAGLARALVHAPEVLLYDEPTTGLDPIMRAQVDRMIVATHRSRPGMTSVVISHDMDSTFEIADHVAMLHEGRIIAFGPPDLFRDHPDERVRQFVEGRLQGPLAVD